MRLATKKWRGGRTVIPTVKVLVFPVVSLVTVATVDDCVTVVVGNSISCSD